MVCISSLLTKLLLKRVELTRRKGKRKHKIGKMQKVVFKTEFDSQTYSAESPGQVEWAFLLYHFLQKVMYGLNFHQRRNVKPATVGLARVEITDTGGRAAFQRTLKEVIVPMGW